MGTSRCRISASIWGTATDDFMLVVALYMQHSEQVAVSPSPCEALASLQIKLELARVFSPGIHPINRVNLPCLSDEPHIVIIVSSRERQITLRKALQ